MWTNGGGEIERGRTEEEWEDNKSPGSRAKRDVKKDKDGRRRKE